MSARTWKPGDVAFSWQPTKDDRFHCERGVIGTKPVFRDDWIVFKADSWGQSEHDPAQVDRYLFPSPEALRVHLLTMDLASDRARLLDTYEAVALLEGEVRASEVRLARAEAELARVSLSPTESPSHDPPPSDA